jgi:hypothetical protein
MWEPPASASQVLRLEVSTTMSSKNVYGWLLLLLCSGSNPVSDTEQLLYQGAISPAPW